MKKAIFSIFTIGLILLPLSACSDKTEEEKAIEEAQKFLDETINNNNEIQETIENVEETVEKTVEDLKADYKEKHLNLIAEAQKEYNKANIGKNITARSVLYNDEIYFYEKGIIYKANNNVDNFSFDFDEKQEVYRNIDLFDTSGDYKGYKNNQSLIIIDDHFIYPYQDEIRFVKIGEKEIVKTLKTKYYISGLYATKNGLIYSIDDELRKVDLVAHELKNDNFFEFQEEVIARFYTKEPTLRNDLLIFTGEIGERLELVEETNDKNVRKIADMSKKEDIINGEKEGIIEGSTQLIVYNLLNDEYKIIDSKIPYLFKKATLSKEEIVLTFDKKIEVKGKNGSLYSENDEEFYLYATETEPRHYLFNLNSLEMEEFTLKENKILKITSDFEGNHIYWRKDEEGYNLYLYQNGEEVKHLVKKGYFDSENDLYELYTSINGTIYFKAQAGMMFSNYYYFNEDYTDIIKVE